MLDRATFPKNTETSLDHLGGQFNFIFGRASLYRGGFV
jgi:hypothetical protein